MAATDRGDASAGDAQGVLGTARSGEESTADGGRGDLPATLLPSSLGGESDTPLAGALLLAFAAGFVGVWALQERGRRGARSRPTHYDRGMLLLALSEAAQTTIVYVLVWFVVLPAIVTGLIAVAVIQTYRERQENIANRRRPPS